jgi:hypothetical protein
MKRVDPACVFPPASAYSTDSCAIGVSWHGTAASVQGWNPLAPQIKFRRESVLAYRIIKATQSGNPIGCVSHHAREHGGARRARRRSSV